MTPRQALRTVAGWSFAMAMLVAAVVWAPTGTAEPPDLERVRLSVAGDLDVVFDWTTDRCEDENIPDLAARAFRDADDLVHLTLPHYRSYEMVGPTLDDVVARCDAPVLGSTTDADPSRYTDREWLASPYTLDGTTVHALIHNEYQGNQHGPSRCPTGQYEDCLDTSITLGVSVDGGTTYAHAAVPPGHLVATEPEVYDATDLNGPSGLRQPSNILRAEDGWYYAALNEIVADDPNSQYVCLMRTQDLADPGSWRYLEDGGSFTGEFRDPYTESGAQRCPALDRDDVANGLSESLRYHPELDAYVLMGMSGDHVDGEVVWGIHYALSRDLVDWTRRRLLLEVPLPWTVEDSGTDLSYLYPSLLDPDSPDRNFDTVDDDAYVYVTRHNEGQSSLDRDLVRLPVSFEVLPAPDPSEPPPSPDGVHRRFGEGRYDTAVAVALDRFLPDDVDTVFIATGTDFPDALSGGPLAAQRGAPILLVPPTSLPRVVAEALGTLAPSTVIALGGQTAVPDDVLDSAARAAGGAVTDRISGDDRYATAAAVAAAMDTSGGDGVLLATGLDFPDALAGGPTTGGAPILLTHPARVPTPTRAALDALAPRVVTALGGTAVVPAAVLDEAASISGASTARLAGDGRFETAAAIAETLGEVDTVYVAVGTNFPDALAAGPAATGEGAPIVLTRTSSLPAATAAYLDALPSLRRVVVLGGTAVVDDGVLAELAARVD